MESIGLERYDVGPTTFLSRLVRVSNSGNTPPPHAFGLDDNEWDMTSALGNPKSIQDRAGFVVNLPAGFSRAKARVRVRGMIEFFDLSLPITNTTYSTTTTIHTVRLDPNPFGWRGVKWSFGPIVGGVNPTGFFFNSALPGQQTGVLCFDRLIEFALNGAAANMTPQVYSVEDDYFIQSDDPVYGAFVGSWARFRRNKNGCNPLGVSDEFNTQAVSIGLEYVKGLADDQPLPPTTITDLRPPFACG